MSDEAVMGIALMITAIFGTLFYRHQKTRKTRKQKFLEKARAAGCCAEGEYEDSRVSLGVENSSSSYFRSDTLKVRYRYTVGGTVYHKSLSFQSPGRSGIDFPSCVKVYYDPRNPKKAVCPEEATRAHQRQSGCLISIAGTFLFLFAVFHLLRFLAGYFMKF